MFELHETGQERTHEAFQGFLSGILDILQKQAPERWLRSLYAYLVRAKRELDQQDPAIREYLNRHLDEVFDLIKQEARGERSDTELAPADDAQARAAQELMHKLEHLLSPDATVERHFTVHRASLERILQDTEHFKQGVMENSTGASIPALLVRASQADRWHALPLPPLAHMLHKGGTPRVILKILAGASLDLIRAELPPNDFDVIVEGDPGTMQAAAVHIGVDIEGIEQVASVEDEERLFATRDIDMNQCFFGRQGLVFSQQALESVRTGNISIEAEERGLYGSEKLYYDGVRLVKARALQRLIKFVAEGKARSFDFLPLNEQIDFGVYWLVLARKFAKKKNRGELLERMMYLGQAIGQTRPHEATLFDVLDRVHAEYPFFDLDAGGLDQTGLARWLGGKMLKFVDRRFRKEQGISLGFSLDRQAGDTISYEVSLEDFAPDPLAQQAIEYGWEAFVSRCRMRTARYHASASASSALSSESRYRLSDEPVRRSSSGRL